MSKEARYLSRQLTKKDKAFINKAFTNFIIGNSAILLKYPDPKELAIQLYKILNLKKTKLNFYSTLFIMDDLDGNVIKPEHLLKYLSNKLMNSQQNKLDVVTPTSPNIRVPNSRDLRQYVLKAFEYHGYLHNYQGKEKHKEHFRKNPGRKSSSETLEDRGGNPSIYKLDAKFEYFKNVIKKPEASDYLFEKLDNNDFFKSLIKYRIRADFYLGEIDESSFLQSFKYIGEALNDEISQKDIEKARATRHLLENINDNQLGKILEDNMDTLKMHRERISSLVLLWGLRPTLFEIVSH